MKKNNKVAVAAVIAAIMLVTATVTIQNVARNHHIAVDVAAKRAVEIEEKEAWIENFSIQPGDIFPVPREGSYVLLESKGPRSMDPYEEVFDYMDCPLQLAKYRPHDRAEVVRAVEGDGRGYLKDGYLVKYIAVGGDPESAYCQKGDSYVVSREEIIEASQRQEVFGERVVFVNTDDGWIERQSTREQKEE